MRAGSPQEPVATLVVAEQDEVFAHEAQRLHGPVAGKLIDQRGRLPVAAQQSPGRAARTDTGDEVVLLLAQHGRVPVRAIRSGAGAGLYPRRRGLAKEPVATGVLAGTNERPPCQLRVAGEPYVARPADGAQGRREDAKQARALSSRRGAPQPRPREALH